MNLLKIKEAYINVEEIVRVLLHNVFNKDKSYFDKKFGKSKRQYYRVYENRESQKGTIFFIHGGGWWHGSPESFSLVGEYFSKREYTVVMPSYRLVPTNIYPDQIKDVMSAYDDYVTSDLYKEKKNKKIVIAGFSAGGELAVNLCFNNELSKGKDFDLKNVEGLLLLSGVLDFSKCYDEHAINLIKNYIGSEKNYLDMNPINLLALSKKVEILCIHGEDDPLIDLASSKSFVDRYKNIGGVAELEILKKRQHRDILDSISNEGDENSYIIHEFIGKHIN